MNNVIKVGVKKLNSEAKLPTYAHTGDAGADLYTLEDTIIKANETVIVKTGIALELPQNMEAQIRPRSGISANGCKGCSTINVLPQYIYECSPYLQVQFGTVDCGYKNDIGVITWNREDYDVLVPKGTRLAQMVIKKTENIELEEIEELSESERGLDGFGSSGLN